MAQVNPYLKFDGNCADAMNFYKTILGWNLDLHKVGDSPVGEHMPASKESILHSVLSNGVNTIMGSDFHWGEQLNNGNGNHICLTCDSEEQITNVYNGLIEDGTIVQPLDLMPWGSLFAQITDKYEKHWILTFDK